MVGFRRDETRYDLEAHKSLMMSEELRSRIDLDDSSGDIPSQTKKPHSFAVQFFYESPSEGLGAELHKFSNSDSVFEITVKIKKDNIEKFIKADPYIKIAIIDDSHQELFSKEFINSKEKRSFSFEDNGIYMFISFTECDT